MSPRREALLAWTQRTTGPVATGTAHAWYRRHGLARKRRTARLDLRALAADGHLTAARDERDTRTWTPTGDTA